MWFGFFFLSFQSLIFSTLSTALERNYFIFSLRLVYLLLSCHFCIEQRTCKAQEKREKTQAVPTKRHLK